MYHQNVARAQRLAYNTHRTDVDHLRGKILIEVDFKQKILIGFGPRQINTEYYDSRNRQRTCLGFGVYYVDNQENKIKLINFDIIAADDAQTAFAVVRGFRLLRERDFFKAIDDRARIKEYIVWMDCGKHFRNQFVAGYLFRELADNRILVNLNFFCEKHGKNGRDAHFSVVSKFVQQASLKKRLICSADVVEAIVEGQKLANQNRLLEGERTNKYIKRNEYVRTEAMEIDYQCMVTYKNSYPKVKPLFIENIEKFYNYKTVVDARTNDIKLVTSLLSNQVHQVINCDKTTVPQFDKEDELVAREEDILYAEDMKKKLYGLQKKKDKLNQQFNLLKGKQPLDAQMFDYFSINNRDNNNRLNIREETASATTDAIAARNIERPVPVGCRRIQIGDKQACSACQNACNLSIDRLLNPRAALYTQKVLNAELILHKHPTSKEIPNPGGPKPTRARTTKEASIELAEHYIYSHDIQRPLF